MKLYPYIDRVTDTAGMMRLWITEDANTYIRFDGWMEGSDPTKEIFNLKRMI